MHCYGAAMALQIKFLEIWLDYIMGWDSQQTQTALLLSAACTGAVVVATSPVAVKLIRSAPPVNLLVYTPLVQMAAFLAFL